jgi:hypothetical protein
LHLSPAFHENSIFKASLKLGLAKWQSTGVQNGTRFIIRRTSAAYSV